MAKLQLKAQPRLIEQNLQPQPIPVGDPCPETLNLIFRSLVGRMKHDGEPVLVRCEGDGWMLRVRDPQGSHLEPAICTVGVEAYDQWCRAGLEALFPHTLIPDVWQDRLYQAIRQAYEAVPERTAVVERLLEYRAWRARDKALWDMGKQLKDKQRWGAWFSAASAELSTLSVPLGQRILQAVDGLLAQSPAPTPANEAHVLQARILACDLQLDGTPLYGYDKYVSIGAQQELHRNVQRRTLMPASFIHDFALVRLATAPALSTQIKESASQLLTLLNPTTTSAPASAPSATPSMETTV